MSDEDFKPSITLGFGEDSEVVISFEFKGDPLVEEYDFIMGVAQLIQRELT